MHTLLSQPQLLFVFHLPCPSMTCTNFPFILSERESQTTFWRSLWKRLPHTRHASIQLGIPLYAGYANRAELRCSKLLQGRHFPSATENQDHAANGQPIDISTTYGRTLGGLWVLFVRSHRRRCLSHWRRGPLVGGLLAGIPLPVSRSPMSVRLHDPLACQSSGSHRPGLRQGPSCQTCLRLLIGGRTDPAAPARGSGMWKPGC